MAVKVIDSSALAALVFVEPKGQQVVNMVQDDDLVAPPLLSFELANVCLTKIRRHPAQKTLLLAGFHMIDQLPLTFLDVNLFEVLDVAENSGLTVYDSSFLWLAITLNVELVTLDKSLTKAFHKIRK